MTDKHKQIADAYESGLTMDQCVEKFTCAKGTVRHALKKHGIKPRSRAYRSDSYTPPERKPKEPKERFYRAQIEPPEPVRTHPVKADILKIAAESCKKLGGFAQIDAQYAVVDITKFQVIQK